ncbi:MAG: prepilin-type N-terminal cleavage/methylation domain-containing protein [Desulfobacteraceae bacterium]|jgi:prepilin-type N-terminal cleavage/methylation domain-containing protein
MKKIIMYFSHGFSLLEMMAVLIIAGILVSIAVPYYLSKREKAYRAECEANRYHIELEERAYYNENNKPSLSIDSKYKCPSGGVYIWLVSDPANSEYPKVGCSVHYIGQYDSSESNEEIISESYDPDEPAPQIESSEINRINDLIDYIEGQKLNTGITNNMVSKLESAITSLEQADNNATSDAVNSLIKFAETQKGKKIPENTVEYIISQAELILNDIQE